MPKRLRCVHTTTSLKARETTVRTADKRFKRALQIALAVVLTSGVLCGASKQTHTAPSAGEQFTPLIHSVEGPNLFRAYCAPCHGVAATGTGPAAPALKAKVPDLTLLAKNNRGQFPAAHVREVIMGDKIVVAHGSREMPIWGPIFHQIESDVGSGKCEVGESREVPGVNTGDHGVESSVRR